MFNNYFSLTWFGRQLSRAAYGVVLFGVASAQTIPLRGYLTAHDPSTIVQCKNRYYLFYTGQGIASKSSVDKVFWSPGPKIFTNPPAWINNVISNFSGDFWAPDIMFFNNKYYLYYAVSSFGSQVSAIGLATNPTLDPTDSSYQWTDQGMVIASTNGSPYNTIDPSLCHDDSGNLWMTFGSYWNGIYLTQLNVTNGLRLTVNSPLYHLAYNSSIEASYLWRHDGYYYLFVNWGSCCSGVDSTYNIRVGRSTNITGPYLDRSGVDMVAGGGTLFLQGTGKYCGPGHVGIFSEDGFDWLSYHYYDANAWAPEYNAYGAPDFNLVPLKWSADDWPVSTNDWSAIYNFQGDARDLNGQYSGLLKNGATIQADSTYGQILNLNGVGQYVSLPPGVANAESFVAIVNWRGGAAWQRIFDFGYDTTRTIMLTPLSDDGVLRCDINPGGSLQTIQGTSPLPTNVWTQVAVTLDGTQGILYLNGLPIATNTTMTFLPLNVAAQTNTLGRSKFSSDPYLNGAFASFRVYSHALSSSELTAPLPVISEPEDGTMFMPGSIIKYTGSAVDFMGRPLSASNLTWQISYVNNGLTNVVFGPLTNTACGIFHIPATSIAGNYLVTLTAMDSTHHVSSARVTLSPGQPPSSWSSYYPFHSDANDANGYYSGTFKGGASIQNDPVRGNVLNLAAIAKQYVNLPSGVSGAQSITGWVKWLGGDSWQRIFDFGLNTNQFFYLTPSDANNLPQVAITQNFDVYNQVFESLTPFTVGQWTHVAVIMNGREGLLYLNGQMVAVNNSVNLLPSDIGATNCNFGKSQFSVDPYFNGRLSDINLNSSILPLASIIAPSAAIIQPTNGTLFYGGQVINFSGIGHDYSGISLPASAFSWSGELHSNGTNNTVFGPLTGITNGSFQIPTNGPNSTTIFHRILLTITDTNGYEQAATLDMAPELSQVDFDTIPSGLQLAVDDSLLNTPSNIVFAAGYSHVISAPAIQIESGITNKFVLWSDGGDAAHSITIATNNARLIASYRPPGLNIESDSRNVSVSWPAWAGPMQLYSATNLNLPVSWLPVTNATSLLNNRLNIDLPLDETSRFFRLQSSQ